MRAGLTVLSLLLFLAWQDAELRVRVAGKEVRKWKSVAGRA